MICWEGSFDASWPLMTISWKGCPRVIEGERGNLAGGINFFMSSWLHSQWGRKRWCLHKGSKKKGGTRQQKRRKAAVRRTLAFGGAKDVVKGTINHRVQLKKERQTRSEKGGGDSPSSQTFIPDHQGSRRELRRRGTVTPFPKAAKGRISIQRRKVNANRPQEGCGRLFGGGVLCDEKKTEKWKTIGPS